MISGEVDIDAEWDTYVKNMKDYGVDRYIEIVQNAYDRFAGAI
jgi:putative aldouronate transport system substrate-binding protein